MLRLLLVLFLLVAACSKGPEADLPYISTARSLGAEWAMVNEQASSGHLTSTYARTMRSALRDQLRTSLKSLTEPRSAYGAEIAALLQEPDDAAPAQLRAHSTRLRQIENQLESD